MMIVWSASNYVVRDVRSYDEWTKSSYGTATSSGTATAKLRYRQTLQFLCKNSFAVGMDNNSSQ